MRLALVSLFAFACTKEPKLELVELPISTDLAQVVRGAIAAAPGQPTLVYVGASWCEPCRHFHAAAAAGQLDAAFGGLKLLMFDADRDAGALARAGYVYDMIPLFAVPKPDGTGSGRQIQGGVKGDGAVAEIVPRLRQLLNAKQ
jgi:thiol-disulfide isomerase/thioredoxin